MENNNINNKEEWNYPGNNPNWDTNYICKINKKGWWRMEKCEGKWILSIEKKEGMKKNKFNGKVSPYQNASTMADQNNFMSALLEVDWHNDNFIFPNNTTRCSSHGNPPTFEFLKRLRILQGILDFYKAKYNGQSKLDGWLENGKD